MDIRINLGILQLILIILKLTVLQHVSWWIIMIPALIPVGIGALGLLLIVVAILFGLSVSVFKYKDK